MPGWQGSSRRTRLPANWGAIRADVLAGDGKRCTWYDHGQRCSSPASEVDHVQRGDDHSRSNLRPLCSYHHGIKSGQEGGQARAAQLKKVKQSFRRTESHPGSLD